MLVNDRVKRVKRVNVRHGLWLIVLLALSAMLLVPWLTEPPAQKSAGRPAEEAARPKPMAAGEKAEQVRLRVAAALEEAEFAALKRQSEEMAGFLRNIEVEWARAEPEDAYASFRREALLGTAADVLLMPGEWVLNFAVSGFLAPTDSAFAGDSQSQQFAALMAPMKWNGYIWGVPRDFDPYVLLWNMNALNAVSGSPSPVLPDGLAGWADLAAKSRAAGNPLPMVALRRDDPLSLLAWVAHVTGERSDTIFADGRAWDRTFMGEALSMLDQNRDLAVFAESVAEMAMLVSEGGVAAAVMPYSSAKALMDAGPFPHRLLMDLRTWKLPYVWPRSNSFAVYARSKAKEAAIQWIAAMTSEPAQFAHWLASGKLPAQSPLFERDSNLRAVLAGQIPGAFPFDAQASPDPSLPQRLEKLAGLWEQFAAGFIGYDEWNERWASLSAEAELHR